MDTRNDATANDFDSPYCESLDDAEHRDLIAGVSGWGSSLIVHGLIAGALMYIFILGELEREYPPLSISPRPPTAVLEEEKEPHTPRDIEPISVEVPATVESERPLISAPDMPVEELTSEDPEISSLDEPQGRDDAIAVNEAGGLAAFMAIGPGGGASGPLGNRIGGQRTRAIIIGSGHPRTQPTIDSGLRWLRRHQSDNGQWDVDGYPDTCADQPRCEPGQAYTDAQGDVAATAYALLCFLGAGHDHRTPNPYRRVVGNGLEWLRSQARPAPSRGVLFGNNRRMYHNAVAALAIAEAYAMTRDPALRSLAQDAIDFIVAEQNRDPRDPDGYGLGWNYTPSASRNDASVSGWATMALKAGQTAGLNTGDAMTGVRHYLERAWRDANPHAAQIGTDDQSLFPYTWNPANGEARPSAAANGAVPGDGRTVCVGALMAVFLEYHPGEPMLESMLNTIMAKQLPTAYPTNTYYLYYNTLTMFQAGGERWQRWNAAFSDVLINSQRRGDGCYDGSWDWQGTVFHGHQVGRIVSTAYNILSLEVYYRYKRANRALSRR